MISVSARAPRAATLEGNRGIRPPLKWAGGKRWLVPRLKQYWLQHSDRRLVEPFCGGLAVTLGLTPERALLNDINPHAINFYKWLSKGLVIRLKMENEAASYYKFRDRFNALIAEGKVDSHEAASLFYYLNRTGYNGLCRFNRSGQFNVPFGRYAAINYLNDFTEYKPVCRDWQFSSGDFESMDIQLDDFVYADPPYDVEFTGYAKEGFCWEDQERLAIWLSQHPGPVILSNQATKRIVKLYRSLGFRLEFLDAPRMISCTGDRAKAKEVLAVKGIRQARSLKA
jgi:DNA adenine methylase